MKATYTPTKIASWRAFGWRRLHKRLISLEVPLAEQPRAAAAWPWRGFAVQILTALGRKALGRLEQLGQVRLVDKCGILVQQASAAQDLARRQSKGASQGATKVTARFVSRHESRAAEIVGRASASTGCCRGSSRRRPSQTVFLENSVRRPSSRMDQPFSVNILASQASKLSGTRLASRLVVGFVRSMNSSFHLWRGRWTGVRRV
jgi:hypothetical protein